MPKRRETDIDWDWPNRHYGLYKDAFDSRDFTGAFQCAFESAIIGGTKFRASNAPEDQYHRALFFGLAAIAAEKVGSEDNLLDMYFMTRIVLEEIGPVKDIQSGYRVSLQDLEKNLTRLAKAVESLGIDPAQNPRIFMRTRKAMVGR
jgi:hypothetical protein